MPCQFRYWPQSLFGQSAAPEVPGTLAAAGFDMDRGGFCMSDVPGVFAETAPEGFEVDCEHLKVC